MKLEEVLKEVPEGYDLVIINNGTKDNYAQVTYKDGKKVNIKCFVKLLASSEVKVYDILSKTFTDKGTMEDLVEKVKGNNKNGKVKVCYYKPSGNPILRWLWNHIFMYWFI